MSVADDETPPDREAEEEAVFDGDDVGDRVPVIDCELEALLEDVDVAVAVRELHEGWVEGWEIGVVVVVEVLVEVLVVYAWCSGEVHVCSFSTLAKHPHRPLPTYLVAVDDGVAVEEGVGEMGTASTARHPLLGGACASMV